MDIDCIIQIIRPVFGIFGLLIFTHALGKLVATPMRGDSSRDAQVRTAAMFLFWIFIFVNFLVPGARVQLALILVAVFYLTAVFSAPLRRMLFRQRRSERDAA